MTKPAKPRPVSTAEQRKQVSQALNPRPATSPSSALLAGKGRNAQPFHQRT